MSENRHYICPMCLCDVEAQCDYYPKSVQEGTFVLTLTAKCSHCKTVWNHEATIEPKICTVGQIK
jgi:hypothetical protein